MLCRFVCHLGGVRVRGVLVDSVDRLEVEVESAREWSAVPPLWVPLLSVWDRRAKRVRDLGVSGRRMTLVWCRHRFECGTVGSGTLRATTSSQVVLPAGSPVVWFRM